jgi:hypothetical protein
VSDYLTPTEAAALRPKFGNADWYREQLRLGRLHGSKIGGRWFTTLDDIDEMVEKGQNFKRRRRNRVMT